MKPGAVHTAGLDTTYAYDANGNRLSVGGAGTQTTFTYGLDNRLESSTDASGQTTTYSYDENGNLKRKVGPSGAVTDYTWDSDNRLLSIAGPDTSASFTYDAEGKRTGKTVDGTTTEFVYDDIKLIAEKDGSGTVTAKYIYDDLGKLVSMKKNNQSYYFHLNHRGDVIKITDASKTVVASYSYDPWGNIRSEDGIFAAEQPFRYASYYWDSDVGMYYLINRFYDASHARFISKDPAADPEDQESAVEINRYVYALSEPVGNLDPDGLWTRRIHGFMTRKWAEEVGFNHINASAIGFANWQMDFIFKSRDSWRKPELWGNRSHHFNIYNAPIYKDKYRHRDSRLDWAKGYRMLAAALFQDTGRLNGRDHLTGGAQPLWFLGAGLHSMQDLYAHGDALRQRDIDKWWDDSRDPRNKKKIEYTKKATKAYLAAWRQEVGLPVPRGAIN